MSQPQTNPVQPFPAFPASGRYVQLGSSGDALSRLFRAIDAREALSLVVGPPGVGKSLLCELVADGHRDSHDVVVINQAPIEHKDSLIKHLLHGLGVKPNPELDVHLQLVDRVCSTVARAGLLIVVDEAQSLATEVLEAVRMVTNITAGGQRRVMAVLCGGPKMDDRLADPSMEALVQRVATRCYLHPLDDGQTRTYIRQTISSCGSDPDQTIDDAAIQAIYLATGGVPRLVNQMMTEAIDCAAKADQGMIDSDMVNMAWANLQQLPSPMVDEAKLGPIKKSPAVEFGALSDFDALPSGESSFELGSNSEVQISEHNFDHSSDLAFDDLDQIVDEDEVVDPTPSARELFGDFSDEEAIDIGVPITAAAPASMHYEPVDVSSFAEATTLDFETKLHDEVVSMSEEAHRQTECCQSFAMPTEASCCDEPRAAEQFGNEQCGNEQFGNEQCGGEQCSDDECGEGLANEDLSNEGLLVDVSERDVQPMATLRLADEETSAELTIEPVSETGTRRGFFNAASDDDSDILIVEDSIELSLETSEDYAAEFVETAPAVNFQEMMTRMRAGA